ncbi:MAG: sulfotransferase [Acidimicrobiales bacterium]
MTERTTFDEARDRKLLKLLDVASIPTAMLARCVRPISVERLMKEARSHEGLDDFGEPDITVPLRHLVDPMRRDDRLKNVGELIQRESMRRLLRSRLRIVDHLKRHPEVERTEVDRPVFIIGLPRTGTTLLQHVLASHPEVRAVEGWESFDPLPRGDASRRRDYRNYLTMVKLIAPAALTVHPMEPEGPEEGLEMIDRTLYSQTLAFFGYREYSQWLYSRSDAELIEAYGLYAAQLKLLVGQRPGRLLVKSPALLGMQGVLSLYFPDARFISTHRDLRAVIPSSLSMAAVQGVATRRVDPLSLGSSLISNLGNLTASVLRGVDDMDLARHRDVRFHELMEDPVGVCRDLVSWLGLELSDDLDDRIAKVLREMPRHKYGRHVYRLEQFGLAEADIADLADGYAEQFGLERESSQD